jgi:ribosomal protein L31
MDIFRPVARQVSVSCSCCSGNTRIFRFAEISAGIFSTCHSFFSVGEARSFRARATAIDASRQDMHYQLHENVTLKCRFRSI